MYCRNCGSQIDPNASVCVKCGYKNGMGNNFCQNCGNPTQAGQAMCTSCGFSLSNVKKPNNGIGEVPEENRILCGVLAIIFTFGIHNFLLGEPKKGILHILLIVPGFFLVIPPILNAIWSIIEGVKILNRTYVVSPDKWFAI